MNPFKISVIVTTYNRKAALALVLDALLAQTDRHFEILVADDGSRSDTQALVQEMMQKSAVPIQHIWQEDHGFRAARIRNKAALSATGDYLIFIDGDCVVRPDFIAQHRALQHPNKWVTGGRILLSESFTKWAEAQRYPLFSQPLGYWLKARIQKNCNRFMPLLSLPLGGLRDRQPKKWAGAKTCNLAVNKKDFEAINGFDESFEGWGFEDSDLVIRLIRLGRFRREGRYATSVFHLWHPENDRSHEQENYQRLQAILNNTAIQAKLGLAQHS